MNLKSLVVFVNVVELGTLAEASARMNLSQSAASRLIQILEDEYGTKLFNRERKRLLPTRAGEVFYPEALRILASIRAIPGLLAEVREEADPPLRILCHPRLISGLIVPAMIRFAVLEPDVRLKLEVHPRRYLGQRILQEAYDIGVSNLPLPIRTIPVEVIASSEIHVLLPRDHPLAGRPVLSPEDMTGTRYIALDESTLLRQLTDLEVARLGHALQPVYEVSSTSAALGLVRGGLGFTLSDRGMVDRDPGDNLVQVPWRPVTRIKIGCFGPVGAQPHPARDLFRRCLIEVGGGHG